MPAVTRTGSAPPPPDDQERFIPLLVSDAQNQLALQAGTSSGYDAKALGRHGLAVADVGACWRRGPCRSGGGGGGRTRLLRWARPANPLR